MTGIRLARLDEKLAPITGRRTPPAPPTCRVVIDRYRTDGPRAQALCRCGWTGTDNADPETAEREAAEHQAPTDTAPTIDG